MRKICTPITLTSAIIGCFLVIIASCASPFTPLTTTSALLYCTLSVLMGGAAAWHIGVFRGKSTTQPPRAMRMVTIISAIALMWCIGSLWQLQSTSVIRSPWNLVPPPLWILMGCGAGALWAQVFRERISLVSIAGWGFMASSIGAIIYTIGYGFDGFIHEASIRSLITNGFIHPFNPTYHGGYFLAAIIALITHIPTQFIVAYGGALLWGMLLIVLILTGRRTLAGAWALMLPVIYTAQYTPWALGMIMVLGIFAFYLNKEHLTMKHHGIALLLTLTAVCIHPFAGMLAFVLFLQGSIIPRGPKVLATVSVFMSAIIIPVFILCTGAGTVHITPPTIPRIFLLPTPQFHFVHDIWYVILPLLLPTCLALAWLGLQKIPSRPRSFIARSAFSVGICAGLLYYGVSFRNVIDSDQVQLSARFLFVACAMLAYPVMLQLKSVYASLPRKMIFRMPLIALLAGISLGTLFMSYPRTDDYLPSRSYSTSLSDIRTTQFIRTHAGDSSFIVLANQQVSAAAIREFGLQPYLVSPLTRETFFYYAVPTGGTLYQYYLSMVYRDPARATAQEVAQYAGVKRVYFVVNTYWWDARTIIEKAQKEASGSQWIDDANFIAWYDFS